MTSRGWRFDDDDVWGVQLVCGGDGGVRVVIEALGKQFYTTVCVDGANFGEADWHKSGAKNVASAVRAAALAIREQIARLNTAFSELGEIEPPTAMLTKLTARQKARDKADAARVKARRHRGRRPRCARRR